MSRTLGTIPPESTVRAPNSAGDGATRIAGRASRSPRCEEAPPLSAPKGYSCHLSILRPIMPHDRSDSSVRLDLDMGRDPDAQDASRVREEAVFRIGIVGDFGAGDGSRAWRVDRDDFDDVLAQAAPALQLDLGNGLVAQVRIRDIDDFHPDQLFERVPQFAQLRALRERLADPASFRRTAASLAETRPPSAPRPKAASAKSSGSLLDSIIGGAAPEAQRGGVDDGLYDFIQRAMAPHLVDRPDPRQAELVAQADASIADVMRLLLHHPDFQALESLWRGVYRLVHAVETSERLQVHLIDMSAAAWRADLSSASSAGDTAIHRRLSARAPAQDGGWGMLVAGHTLGERDDDLARLQMLTNVGASLNAPWLAEAHPMIAVGELSPDAMASWVHLRTSPSARYLGLALPRVLLRLPYGAESDPVERFDFEELESPDAHASYLWGNPALFCATSVAQGVAEHGAVQPGGHASVIEDLPLHLTRRDGETTTKPCAELLMREEEAISLIEAGFIPMLSYRDQAIVRIGRLQSVATPVPALAGRLFP